MYLNWALGLRTLGCRVIWLEQVQPRTPTARLEEWVVTLTNVLRHYGLSDTLALYPAPGETLPLEVTKKCLDLNAATGEADLLLNQLYDMQPEVVRRFRRSALLDSDPGLLQYWMEAGATAVAPHDMYFTIGERLGTQGGVEWQHSPPCVSLDWWPVTDAAPDAPFTTVSHWQARKWAKDSAGVFLNDKRTAFLPFADLPQSTTQPLELALTLTDDEMEEQEALQQRGWRVRNSSTVATTPWDYQSYIQLSRGEFSCAKPSYVRMQNAWMSDRTLCYLASGKPAIVQHTGPSSYLPDAGGLFRFRDVREAVNCLEVVAADYDHQCRLAREVAEEFFDARKVFGRLLERALS